MEGLISLGRNAKSDMDDRNLYLGSIFEVKGEQERFSQIVMGFFNLLNTCCVPGSETVLLHLILTVTLRKKLLALF